MSDEHSGQFHLANEHLTAGRPQQAVAIFEELLKGSLDDFGKSMACVNLAIIHDQLGQTSQALAAYDRGIGFERLFDGHAVTLRKADYCMEKQRHEEALALLAALERSAISDLDKASVCVNAATACAALDQPDRALAWYERGIGYERPHHRFAVAEHKAWYLSTRGRTRESLAIYDALLTERSMTEADKARISNNIGALRK